MKSKKVCHGPWRCAPSRVCSADGDWVAWESSSWSRPPALVANATAARPFSAAKCKAVRLDCRLSPRMIVAALTMARLPWGCCQQLNKAPSSRYLARTDFARFRKEIGKRRHERREGVGECVAVALPGLTVTVAVPGMSPRPIRYSKVWPYVEDTKSRSKVSESEEDLANSGYASPSCFSLFWFAWKADCSASVRQYLWSGRRVAAR